MSTFSLTSFNYDSVSGIGGRQLMVTGIHSATNDNISMPQ